MKAHRGRNNIPTLPLDADEPIVVLAAHRLDLARALAGGVVASLAVGDTRGARVALEGLRGLVELRESAHVEPERVEPGGEK